MASKKRKNEPKKQSASKHSNTVGKAGLFQRFSTSFGNFWNQKSPVLKFLLGFAGCMAIFYILYLSPFFVDNVVRPILNVEASISSAILNLFGQNTTANADVISGEDFSISIKNGCDGLETLAIMLIGIVIFPITFRLKWPGIIIGTVALMVLNLFRIAALYIVGRNFSKGVFDILHAQGGFVLFTAFGVFLWILWANWALNKRAGIASPAS
ncbi:MAG: archaeosortase/exosortase family protein [Saprospiraceae bacterium]